MFAHRFGIYKFHTYLFTCTSVRQTCPHREAVFFTLLNPDAEEAFIIQSGMLVGMSRIIKTHIMRIAFKRTVILQSHLSISLPSHQTLREFE